MAGVSMLTRGLRPSAASRVSATSGRRSGRHRPGDRSRRAAGLARRGLARHRRLRLLGDGRLAAVTLLEPQRHAEEVVPGDQHDARQDDGQEKVLVVFTHGEDRDRSRPSKEGRNGASRPAVRRPWAGSRCRARDRCRRRGRYKRPTELRGARSRPRRAGVSAWLAPASRAAALRRRLIRLRSVACPTFLVTVKPKRKPAPSGASVSRRRPCRVMRSVWKRRPAAAARNSGRFVNRPRVRPRVRAPPPRIGRPSRGQALAAVGAARRDHLAAALGRHARPKAVAALANELARLIRPLHGLFSDRKMRGAAPGKAPSAGSLTDCLAKIPSAPVSGRCVDGAAYGGWGPQSQRGGTAVRNAASTPNGLSASSEPPGPARSGARPPPGTPSRGREGRLRRNHAGCGKVLGGSWRGGA